MENRRFLRGLDRKVFFILNGTGQYNFLTNTRNIFFYSFISLHFYFILELLPRVVKSVKIDIKRYKITYIRFMYLYVIFQ